MLMKNQSFTIQSSDIDQQEMPNKEVTVGWNVEMVERKHLVDLPLTHYTRDTNQQLKVNVVNQLQQEMRRGDTFSENFQITSPIIANPIIDQYENELAGWGVIIDIEVPTNELSLC